MWYIIVIYLLINSFLTSMSFYNRFMSINEIFKEWVLGQFLGLFILLFNLIPRWNWFLDNVTFWFYLWFTDRYKDMDPELISLIQKHLGHKRQFKAMNKKYGYENTK